MTQAHPVVERYLARFDTAIAEWELPDREEITSEIRNHLAEGLAAGVPLDAILETLGPADDLARGYATELAAAHREGELVTKPERRSIRRRVRRLAGRIGRGGVAVVAGVGRGGVAGVAAVGRGGVAGVAAVGRGGVAGVRAIGRGGVAGVATVGRLIRRALGGLLRAGLTILLWPGRHLGPVARRLGAGALRATRALGGGVTLAAGTIAGALVAVALAMAGTWVTALGMWMLVVGVLDTMGQVARSVQVDDLPPAFALALAPMVMLAGIGLLLLLRLYLQWLLPIIRRRYPSAWGLDLADRYLVPLP